MKLSRQPLLHPPPTSCSGHPRTPDVISVSTSGSGSMIVHEMENELIKIWNLTIALSDQLQENRAITAQLRAQADILKVLISLRRSLPPPALSLDRSIDQGSPFRHGSPLTSLQSRTLSRQVRFQLQLFTPEISHLLVEAYNAELEKTNVSVLAENQNLLNENKQLNALVREYEQTLETIMSKFRTHAVCLTLRFYTHLIFTLARFSRTRARPHSPVRTPTPQSRDYGDAAGTLTNNGHICRTRQHIQSASPNSSCHRR